MAVSIKVPDSAYHKQSIDLGVVSYNITFKFNVSDEAWYFLLSDLDDVALTDDIKVMPNQNLTGRFPYSRPLPNGDIWCFRFKNDYSPIDRNNLGIDKNYELVYLPDNEALELGYDNTVQL